MSQLSPDEAASTQPIGLVDDQRIQDSIEAADRIACVNGGLK
jgi:hypothetical protein